MFVGVQKKIILALCENCRSEGSRVTRELTIDSISQLSGCNKFSIKTNLSRLKKMGAIKVFDIKKGRSGWVRYEVCFDLID